MKCSYLTLSQYLDGELEPAVTGEVDAHLVGCERCHSALDMMRSEAKRIRQLVHIHANDDVVRHLFVELGLQEEDAPLPERKSSTTSHTPNESLPWLRAETNGAALPWSPEAPASQHDMNDAPASEPSAAPVDDDQSTAISNQHGDPSSLPVPSSSPSLTEEGSHAAASSAAQEQERPIELPGNPQQEDPGVREPRQGGGTSHSPQAEPMSEWGALHLQDSAALHASTEVLEHESPAATPSPWRPPTIAPPPSVLEDGPTAVSPRPSTALASPEHTAQSDAAQATEMPATEKKTAFLGMEEDDESEVVLLHPGFKDQILFRVQALLPRFSHRREEDTIETLHGVGAPQERVHSAPQRLLHQGASVAGFAATQVGRAVAMVQKARDHSHTVESQQLHDEALLMDPIVTADAEASPAEDHAAVARGDSESHLHHEVDTDPAKNVMAHSSSFEGRHASAVAAHRKSRSTDGGLKSGVAKRIDALVQDRSPSRVLQFIGGGIVVAALAATLLIAHRPAAVQSTHAAAHHAAPASVSASVQPTATPASHGAQQIALTNVQTLGTSAQPVEVQDLRYGQHAGYYRVVFDLTGSTESQVTIGTDAATGNVIVVIRSARPQGSPAPLSETTTITAVHMIPPSAGVNETVYEFSVAKPVTVRPSYLLGPTRLIVDFIPQ